MVGEVINEGLSIVFNFLENVVIHIRCIKEIMVYMILLSIFCIVKKLKIKMCWRVH